MRSDHRAAMIEAPTRAVPRKPEAGDYSQERYELHERRCVMVPMRDGVRLCVDLYIPKTDEKVPALLALSPYDRGNARAAARFYAARGYVFCSADSRGRYNSDGIWDPFDANHKTDGYDLVEWLADQPWSNEKVGMWGGSYLGWTQWWTASTAPPHLAAIAPLVAPPDAFENIPYLHGVLMGGFMPDWAAMMSGRTTLLVDETPYGGWQGRRRDDFKHTPYVGINAYRGIENSLWFEEWYRRNTSTDPYWEAIAYQGEERYARTTVPSFAVTGWFDVNHPGSPLNYIGMKRFGATPEARRPVLIIGPWTHGVNQRVVGGVDYGPDATIDLDGLVVRWYDHFLKGIDNGVAEDPRVYVFVMGENRWYAEQDWPLPQTQFTKYYLTSGGHANSLKGDGLLSTTPPARDGSDTYLYDPRRPTLDASTNISSHNGHLDGPVDTRLSAIGDEVLVYDTPPLSEPVEVTGPIEATLYASTTARDTDWLVRLVDVHPDGRTQLLADGALRARNRDPENEGRFNAARLSSIEPEQVYRYTIRFWRGTGNLFGRGHRIRVEISSSWFPTFLPNLNTGADNVALESMSDAVVAQQTVRHGPAHASHILLPVIPRRDGSRVG